MTIKEGDTVYILRDWPTRQIKATVLEVTTFPKYPKGRARGYRVETEAGETQHVYHTGYHYSLKKRIVRKTPFPDVEIGREWTELDERKDG
jgi:L-ascorbate metabolism protein UlaG (beta-lactamase superfamily)